MGDGLFKAGLLEVLRYLTQLTVQQATGLAVNCESVFQVRDGLRGSFLLVHSHQLHLHPACHPTEQAEDRPRQGVNWRQPSHAYWTPSRNCSGCLVLAPLPYLT